MKTISESSAVMAAGLVVGLVASAALGSSIIELIGGDPYALPKAPNPTVFFSPSPEPNHVLSSNPVTVVPLVQGALQLERLADANLPDANASYSVPTKLGSFDLEGGPVSADGSDYNVHFSLDPAYVSAGEMTIRRSGESYGGTFESFFDVFLVAHFEPVPGSGGTAFDLTTVEHFALSGEWVGVPLDPGAPELQRFLVTTPLVIAEDAANGGVLYLQPIPEPAALSLLAVGVLAMLRRRKA